MPSTKDYYQKNRDKILEQKREYYQKNKKRLNEKSRKYYQEHKGEIIQKVKEWTEKNPNNHKELMKKYRKEWKHIITELYGKISCKECGYDKNFFAMDFHHIDTSKKETNISRFFPYKPTKKRIESLKKELKKGHFLCATCHREIHFPNGFS